MTTGGKRINSAKVYTYTHSDASHLLPVRGSKLLFAAYLFHRTGFQEELEYRIGRSKCGRYDVLWQHSDWDDQDPTALAWVRKGELTGRALWKTLLIAVWRAEKKAYDYDRPVFNEVNYKKAI